MSSPPLNLHTGLNGFPHALLTDFGSPCEGPSVKGHDFRQIGGLWGQGFLVKAIYDGDGKAIEVGNFAVTSDKRQGARPHLLSRFE